MYREISIENFRGFRNYQVCGLGRVNLLVGTNNSGKSTILEAIEILSSFGEASTIWTITERRGEHEWFEHRDKQRRPPEAIVTHLFHGHHLKLDMNFVFRGQTESGDETFTSKIINLPMDRQIAPHSQQVFGEEGIGSFALRMEWSNGRDRPNFILPLSLRGGLYYHFFPPSNQSGDNPPIRYIPDAALSVAQVAKLFDEIVLTNEESVLIDALNTIDPTIERIASLSGGQLSPNLRNIVLKCKGVDDRIPIGSMGDGIWRMLGIAIALVTAEDGILLVDEIDTGLHYSVMADMWRLVERTAERLNVQVFATTHSRDCFESLATIAHEEVTEKSQVTIQRIERDKPEAVAFSERDIVIAAERGLEVR